MLLPTDRELVRRVIAGDTDAADRLVRRHQAGAWRAAYRACGDRALADEAFQEGFIRAFRYLGSYDPDRPFGTWLAAIVVNRAHTLRARDRTNDAPLEAADGIGADTTGLVDTRLDLDAALERLPVDQRRALFLCAVVGLSTDEAARVSGVSPGALRVRLSRARARLREMDADGMEPDAVG